MLIVEKGTALPDLCLYSGEPTVGKRVTKKLWWAPPTLALLIVVSALIYLIVYFIVRKSGTIEYSLSEDARNRRTSGIVVGFGGVALSFVLLAVAAEQNSGGMILGALALMILALVFGILRARVIHVARIDHTHIHLRLRPETAQAFAAALAR